MNLQQFEYLVVLTRERHFVKAAEKCFVTQATLSMMIKKLEEELGVQLFDRSHQPISPTQEGLRIAEMASKILSDVKQLRDFALEVKGQIKGEVRLAIIPTLAPYLLPLFLKKFSAAFPLVKLIIREQITSDIISNTLDGSIDIGICATPLNNNAIKEYPLFYEMFYAYASQSEKLPGKKYLLPDDINASHLWLLEEGHCLRNQVINFCELKKSDSFIHSIHYEAGSIETLIQLVDRDNGITIIPQLAAENLSGAQRKKLREFANPKPVREVSMVTRANFQRTKLVDEMHKLIKQALKNHNISFSKPGTIVPVA